MTYEYDYYDGEYIITFYNKRAKAWDIRAYRSFNSMQTAVKKFGIKVVKAIRKG